MRTPLHPRLLFPRPLLPVLLLRLRLLPPRSLPLRPPPRMLILLPSMQHCMLRRRTLLLLLLPRAPRLLCRLLCLPLPPNLPWMWASRPLVRRLFLRRLAPRLFCRLRLRRLPSSHLPWIPRTLAILPSWFSVSAIARLRCLLRLHFAVSPSPSLRSCSIALASATFTLAGRSMLSWTTYPMLWDTFPMNTVSIPIILSSRHSAPLVSRRIFGRCLLLCKRFLLTTYRLLLALPTLLLRPLVLPLRMPLRLSLWLPS